ncbi:MAG: hypothetical protein LC127_05930 [Chitinophagales bacterium]|nr:hypothetical protein [Chitinophagales bacterium]
MIPIPFGFNTLTLTYSVPKVGEAFGGGFIAYIYQPSDPQYDEYYNSIYVGPYNKDIIRGIIISTASIANSQLGPGGTWSLPATNSSGAQSTTTLYNWNSNSSLAASRVETLSFGGFTDWFIPSQLEMLQIVSLTFSRQFLTQSYYWTTNTNSGSTIAYGIDTLTWTAGLASSDNSYGVRAFRYFTIYT